MVEDLKVHMKCQIRKERIKIKRKREWHSEKQIFFNLCPKEHKEPTQKIRSLDRK